MALAVSPVPPVLPNKAFKSGGHRGYTMGLLTAISLPAVWALVGNGSVLAIAAFVVVGLAVGHFLGGPDPEDRMVLAISTATRHPGIAVPIIATATDDAKQAAAAVILYLLVSALVSAPYLKLLSRSARTPSEASPVRARL